MTSDTHLKYVYGINYTCTINTCIAFCRRYNLVQKSWLKTPIRKKEKVENLKKNTKGLMRFTSHWVKESMS